ncbi:UNVERIFIED_CONTAM: dense granule protein GRA3 [Hammondia hammondi]|eukprot:XP_008882092.1 dense granule protein GRA3 [Hammondia hammondi]
MDRTICNFFVQSFTMSTASKRHISFLALFVAFLVATASGGLAAAQSESHQPLGRPEPVAGVGEAKVSPVSVAGESYNSPTSGVQEAVTPDVVSLEAINARPDEVYDETERGERMEKLEEDLSLLRRELYERTSRPGVKRAMLLSLVAGALMFGRAFPDTVPAPVPWYAIAIPVVAAAYYIRKVLTYPARVKERRQPLMNSIKSLFRWRPKNRGEGVKSLDKK